MTSEGLKTPHRALTNLGIRRFPCVVGVMRALSEFTLGELEQQLVAWRLNPVHAARLLRDYYTSGGELVAKGEPYPAELFERLRLETSQSQTVPVVRQVAEDGTTKLLLRLADGRTVETVLMSDFRVDRAAGCISSQVGCAMGCDFCATTKNGFERNLTAGEIVDQFLALRREALATNRRLQTLVFMGMGEPMLNLDAVLAAVERIAENRIGAFGWRQITISTVGIVPGMDALTAAGLNLHLAVSLHAPDDRTRAQLLPAGRRYPIADILAAADRFQASRGRTVTIQYCLLKDVNDSLSHARALAAVLGTRRMHVNLLRYNPTGLSLRGLAYERSPDDVSEAFAAELRTRGIVAHFRRPRGRDIDAACGQLRERVAATAGQSPGTPSSSSAF